MPENESDDEIVAFRPYTRETMERIKVYTCIWKEQQRFKKFKEDLILRFKPLKITEPVQG